MAGSRGRTRPDLRTRLATEPWRFDALQAVRLLDMFDGREVRLSGSWQRNFPAGEVSVLSLQGDRTRLEIAAFGIADIIPDAYLELIRNRGTSALRDFLAPIDHRLQQGRLDRQALLSPRHHDESDMASALVAILGMASASLPDPGRLRATVGLSARRTLSLEAISRLMAWQLATPVKAEPFCGRHVDLPKTTWSPLGHRDCRLGRNSVLGRRAFVASAAIRLVAGPVDLSDADDFTRNKAKSMARLARFAAGPEMSVDCRLAICPGSIKGSRLDASRSLGRTAFLGSWWRDTAPCLPIDIDRSAA